MDKDEQRKYKKERYDWLKEHGICVRCGCEPAYKGMTRCIYCRAIQNAAAVERKRLHPFTQEQREAKRVYSMSIRAERKRKGLCPRCGKPHNNGKINCERCNAQSRASQKRRREREGLISRAIAADIGLCSLCLRKPAVKGKKLCESCYEKAVKRAENARKYINHKNHNWRNKNNSTFAKNGGNCHVGESTENCEMPAE